MRIVQQSEWGSSGKDEQMVRMTRQRLQEILLYLRTTLIMSCSPAIPAQPASCGIFKVYFPKRRKDKLNESDPSFMLSYGENDEIKYYEDLFNLFFFLPTYSKQIFIFEIKLNYNVAESCWVRVQAEHQIIHDDVFGMILNLWGMRVGELIGM